MKSQQEARELFDVMANNMLDGMVVIDWEGGILFANRAAYRIAGLRPRKDPRGLNMAQFIHEDDLQRALEDNQLAKEGKGGFLDEFRIVTPRGDIRWIEAIGQKVPFRGQEANLTTFRDVTLRKQSEEALKLSEQLLLLSEKKFAAAFHASPLAISISEPATGRFMDVNRAYEALTGFSRKDLVGREVLDLGIWADPGDRARYLELVQARGRVDRFGARLRKKDGTLHDVMVSGSILEVGDQRHLLTIVHDVTEQKRAAELLQLSEQKFSLAFQSSPDAISISELATGRIVDINRAYERRTGYSREELIDHTTTELGIWAHPEERERFMDALRRDRALNLFEATLRTKAGQFRDMLLSATVIAIGGTEYILSLARDITKRKRTERALRESEERYRKITAAITDYIYTVYLEEGNVTRTVHSAACEAVTGYTAEDFEKNPYLWFSMVVEEDREMVREHFNRVTAGERVYPIEHRIRRKDGAVRWVSNMPVIHRDETGVMDSYDGVVSDITGRKEAERALRERQARLDSIFRVAPTGIGVVVDRVLVEVNDRICEMTGYARDELVGRSARVLYPSQEDYDFVGAEKYRQIAEKGTGTVETRWLRKDGSVIDIILSSTPIDPQNHSAGVTFTALDITDRRKIENALRESEERYRLMAELTGKLVYDCHVPSGRITWHGAVSQVTGFVPERFGETDMKTWIAMIHPEDRDRTAAILDAARAECGPYQAEYRVRRKDREYIYVEDHGVFVADMEGRVSRMLGSIGDITQRKNAEELLREKTEELNRFFDVAVDLLCIAGTDGRFRLLNRAWERVLGYSREELMAGRFFDFVHPDDVKSTEDAVARVASGHEVVNFVNRYLRSDGSYCWLEWRAAPEGDTIYAAARDITERRQAEEALRESEERYHSLFDNSHAVMLLIDPETGAIVDANPAACTYYGATRQELTARKITDINTLSRDEIFAEMEKARRQGKRSFLFRHRLCSGEIRDVEVFSGPITVAGRTLLYSIVHDITERKRAEEALRESENRFRTLIQSSSDIIAILDKDWRITYETPSFSRILGYQPGALLGKSPLENIHPDDVPKVAGDLGEVYEKRNDGTPTEFRFRRADGTWVHLEAIGNNLMDYPGIEGIIVTARDITERKREEEHRLEMERRLLHAQRLESLGVMAGGIAHDFNNLLMAILGNLDLAQLDLSPVSRSRPYVDHALVAARRAADLTNQMLAYSGKGRFDLKVFDLSELVEEMSHLLKASISKTVTLNLQTPRGLPPIKADPGQIQQIVMNLIVNASEAIGEAPGVVGITTGVSECDRAFLQQSRLKEKPEPGTFVFLEVTDTGCGMDDETMDRLFDPFFTTKFTGRGLGLAAVSGIITGHRGAIVVRSRPGAGTSITVLIPEAVVDEEKTGPDRVKQAKLPPARKKREGTGGTVLVVDDEDMVRELCASMVERLGFDVLTAADGEEALEVFRKHAGRICCVILDLTMPRKDGMETLEELKKMDEKVRVILSSGYNEQETTQRFLGKGLAGFIKKPYRLESLRTELDRVLKYL